MLHYTASYNNLRGSAQWKCTHALTSDVWLFVACRLKDLLRKRLKECGWRDQLKEQCKGE